MTTPPAPAPANQPTPPTPTPAPPPAPAAAAQPPSPAPPVPAPAAQPPAPAAAPAPAPSPAPAPVPTPPTWSPPPPAPPDDGMDGLDKLPQKWQKTITDLRNENAKNRVAARSETVLRHAYATAGQHGVNGDALLGSVAFTTAASALDPNAEDFPAKLAAAIQATLTANPWMAAQQAAQPLPVPPTSGGQFPGAPGAPAPSLEQQIVDAEKAGDHRKLIHLKRLRNAQPPTQ